MPRDLIVSFSGCTLADEFETDDANDQTLGLPVRTGQGLLRTAGEGPIGHHERPPYRQRRQIPASAAIAFCHGRRIGAQ
ncbi:MAG: hypothetical protein ACREHF_12820 [Rhizomicrobium sp.]